MRALICVAALAAACTSDPFARGPCAEPGAICTAAGTGQLGFNGDGLPARETALYFPTGLAWHVDGTLLVDDFNNQRIRALTDDGRLVTVAGNGVHGWATPGAPVLESDLENPVDIAVRPDGALVIAELHTSRILEVRDGIVDILAGTGDEGFTGDGGPAVEATFHDPSGLAVHPDGRVFVADTSNHAVRVIEADGTLSTLLGDGTAGTADPDGRTLLNRPQRVEVGGDRLFVADTRNHRVLAVDLDTGRVEVVAGNGTAGFSGDDGPAVEAQLNQPWGLAYADDGSLYVADFGNHRVRRIAPDGTITTFAGNGTPAWEGDEGPADEACLNTPADVLAGPDGAIWIADMSNGLIRRVAP